MRPDWREVPKGDVRTQWAGFYVTLNPQGWIAFSRTTWEKMGAPKAFQVLFDTVNNRIGLKPAALTARNAYKVHVHSSYGGKRLIVGRMMKEFKISLPETIRFYDADTDDDGVLILDLRTARVSGKVRNHWANKKKRAESGE